MIYKIIITLLPSYLNKISMHLINFSKYMPPFSWKLVPIYTPLFHQFLESMIPYKKYPFSSLVWYQIKSNLLQVTGSMAGVVKAMESAMKGMNLEKVMLMDFKHSQVW